jgi:tight adherence protein B
MLIAIVVFLFVTGLVFGGYYAATYLPTAAAGRRFARRLQELGPTGDVQDGTPALVRKAVSGPLPVLDRLLRGNTAGVALARLIDQSGIRTTPSALVIISVAAACVVGILVGALVRLPFAGVGGMALGGILPFAFLLQRRSSRLRRFEEQFPDALDLLSRALRAGHAFQSALGMVAEELPEPVGPEFRKTFEQQNFGLPLNDALNELAERTGLVDVRFFVTAVAIQRETGGNLAEILDNLANVVRERFKLLRQVRVHTAHGRITGFVLLALPAALGVVLSVISPDHMHPLFIERLGRLMLAGAVVMQTIGFFWIRQVIKIEV